MTMRKYIFIVKHSQSAEGVLQFGKLKQVTMKLVILIADYIFSLLSKMAAVIIAGSLLLVESHYQVK